MGEGERDGISSSLAGDALAQQQLENAGPLPLLKDYAVEVKPFDGRVLRSRAG